MLHRTLRRLLITGFASSILFPTAVLAADAEVSLLSATPAAPSGDGDWCIGTSRVTLTAHAVDLSTSAEISKGRIVWQFCANVALGGLPKEECTQGGLGRWTGEVISILAHDATPSIQPNPRVPIIGVRLQFRPAAGSPYKRDLSPPFNLDRTC
jgi:hypothetical protein